MCGLLGLVNLSEEIIDLSFFKRLLKLLDHRGPDDTHQKQLGNIIFGNTRLSIIGVNERIATLPISDNNNILCFNGEIYNYKEINKFLNTKNIYTSGRSDSETLFLCLKHFGIKKTLSMLDGMYAFAYYDYNKKYIYLARDKIGERFLYYSLTPEKFIFSSEIKVIHEANKNYLSPNIEAIKDYFFTSKINGRKTMFKEVDEVEPGTFLSYNISRNKINIEKYWDIENTFYNSNITENSSEIESLVLKGFDEAIRSRLVSDVPITFLVSGGIDSQSLLERALNLNRKFKTKLYFADNYNKKFSEYEDLMLSLNFLKKRYPENNLRLFTSKFTLKSCLEEMQSIVWYYDEPVQFLSSILLSKLCKQIKSHNHKVAWSGEGADEIFFGYERFVRTSNQYDENCSVDTKIGKIYYGGGTNTISIINQLTASKEISNEKELQTWSWLKKNHKKDFNVLQQIYSLKFRLLMLLQRQDRIGMKNSIEVRVPYLSPDFVSLVNSLNIKHKFDKKNNETKVLLKNIFKHKIHPKILYNNKKGFLSDMLLWINSESFYKSLKTLINSTNSFCQSYLDGNIANQIIEGHFNNNKNYPSLIWTILSLELWHKKFFN